MRAVMLLLALSGPALANEIPIAGAANGDTVSGAVPYSTTAGVASPVDTTGPLTQTAITCGTTSTTLLAAGTATSFLKIKVPANAANAVWLGIGVAATTASPSEDVQPGDAVSWSAATDFLPTSALACVSLAPQTITIEYH